MLDLKVSNSFIPHDQYWGKQGQRVSSCQMQTLNRLLRSSSFGSYSTQRLSHFFHPSFVIWFVFRWRIKIVDWCSSFTDCFKVNAIFNFCFEIKWNYFWLQKKVLFSNLNPSLYLKWVSVPSVSYTTAYSLHFKWIVATRAYSVELLLNPINSTENHPFPPTYI